MVQTLLPPTKVSKRAARTVKMASATADRSKNLSITTGGKISAKSVENLSIISSKLINVDNFLRDSLVLDKVKAGIAQKKAEQDLRDRKEDESEKDAPGKLKLPGQKFLKKANNWITKLLFGWLAIKLLDWLPTIKEWLPKIAAAVKFVFKWGGKLLNGLVTFIDKGYEAYDKTRGWVKNKFGDEGVQKFDAISGHLNKAFNIIGAIALAVAAFDMGGGGGGTPRGPRRGPRNQWKRFKNRLGRITNPNAKALERLKRIKELEKQRKAAQALLQRQRFLRRFRPTNVGRVLTTRAGRLQQAANPLLDTGAGIVQKGRNIVQQGGSILDDLRSGNIKPRGTGQGGWWKSIKNVGGNIVGGIESGAQWTAKQGQRAFNWSMDIGKKALGMLDDFAKRTMGTLDNIVKGVVAKGAELAKKVGDIADMVSDPKKLIAKVKEVIKGPLDDILKKNKFLKQLVELGKNPKKAIGMIKGLLEGAKKSKGLMNFRGFLQKAKAAKIGGVDAVIAGVLGLVDYLVFKESPVNAITKALGGLLGYSLGFAVGAPFGGAPGFITGMAGAWLGEELGQLIAKGIAGTDLGKMMDPIAGDGRPIARDPDKPIELSDEQKKIEEDLVKKQETMNFEEVVDDKPDVVVGDGSNIAKNTQNVSSQSSAISQDDPATVVEGDVVFVPLPAKVIPVSNGEEQGTLVSSSSNGNGSVDGGELYIR